MKTIMAENMRDSDTVFLKKKKNGMFSITTLRISVSSYKQYDLNM